jgi:signal transduction histidine kinase
MPGQIKADSIFNIASDKPDSAKFNYYSGLCWEYRYNNTKLSLESGAKALEIARKQSNKNYESKILNLIGVVFKGRNNPDLAMEYAQKALTAAQEAKDSIEIGYAENNTGAIYEMKSFNTLAIEHILTALKIFEHLNYKRGIAYCTVNLATIFKDQHNLKKSIEYYSRALAIRTELGDKIGRGLLLNSMAAAYLDNGSFDMALSQYMECRKIAEEEGDKNLLSSAYNGLSKIKFYEKDYQAALDYQLEASKLFKEIGNKVIEVSSDIYLSAIYSNLKKFKEAEEYLKLVENYPDNAKTKKQVMNYYGANSVFFELKGDLKKALYFNRLHSDMKDSIDRYENLAQSDELVAVDKYLSVKNQNLLLQNSIKFEENQKKYLAVITSLLIITFMVIFWRYRAKKAANKKLSKLNTMKDLLFGIIAHDLKNPFQSILGNTGLLLKELDNLSKDEMKSLITMIDVSGKQTFRLLENLLYWSLSQTDGVKFDPEKVSLSEIANETMALLTNLAHAKNIMLNSNSIEEYFAFCDKEMIKLVFRNLVTNAIKFTLDGGKVNIEFTRKEGIIEVSVSDTGIGMSPETRDSLRNMGMHTSVPGTIGEMGTGLGLMLCKDFIEKNNGYLLIDSEPGTGSNFHFTIPAAN